MNIEQHKVIAIIGTDTGVGKTYITVKLLKRFNRQGLTTCGLKPIASGGFYQNNKLVNRDALLLQQTASECYDYDLINPNAYLPPIAPHIAAKRVGAFLSVDRLTQQIYYAMSCINPDIILLEGVGGLLTPLNLEETYADFIKALNIPVILVVKIGLGCINHALLTVRFLQQENIICLGWIANCMDQSMLAQQENIETLQAMLVVPEIKLDNDKR